MVKHYDTTVELSGVKLDNPIIPASGTFGFGYEFAEIYDINILGSISLKGTTKEARFGNPTPRIAECYAGMINAVGLQNPGIDHFVKVDLPYLMTKDVVVLANIAGSTPEECAETAAKLEDTDVHIIELNIFIFHMFN